MSRNFRYTIESHSARAEEDTELTNEIIKANPQVKIISIYWVLGSYDGVLIAEAPNEEIWLRFVEQSSDYLISETLIAVPRVKKVLKIIENRS